LVILHVYEVALSVAQMVPYANDLRSPGFASMNTQADKAGLSFGHLTH